MKIIIETIPHEQQRYPTVGDYYRHTDGTDKILVSHMGDWRFEFLVAIHELIEYYLCRQRGIHESVITEFDKKYESERSAGKHGPDDEPGFDRGSPYRKEHHFATAIEMLVAKELNVNWEDYGKCVSSL